MKKVCEERRLDDYHNHFNSRQSISFILLKKPASVYRRLKLVNE